MKKILRHLFLIIISLIFLGGIAKAEGFYIQFIDNNDGTIKLKLKIKNNSDTTYYIGIAPSTDHDNYIELLSISPYVKKVTSTIYLNDLSFDSLYDIYLTPDHNTFYWSSQGDAIAKVVRSKNIIKVNWKHLFVKEKFKTFKGDHIKLVPVPIPPALYLLGSGIVALSLVRRKI